MPKRRQPAVRKKVIVNTDMGWDDVLSILYLMKHPAIEIVGVAVTGCGETNLRWGQVIARTLMELGQQRQATARPASTWAACWRSPC